MATIEEQIKAEQHRIEEQRARNERHKETQQKQEQQKTETLKKEEFQKTERDKEFQQQKVEQAKLDEQKRHLLLADQEREHQRQTGLLEDAPGQADNQAELRAQAQHGGTLERSNQDIRQHVQRDLGWQRRDAIRDRLDHETDRKIKDMNPDQRAELKADMEARHGRPGQELTDAGMMHYAKQEAHCREGVQMTRAEREDAAARNFRAGGDANLLTQQEQHYRMRERPEPTHTEQQSRQQQHEHERTR
jgi:hypothetical protein